MALVMVYGKDQDVPVSKILTRGYLDVGVTAEGRKELAWERVDKGLLAISGGAVPVDWAYKGFPAIPLV